MAKLILICSKPENEDLKNHTININKETMSIGRKDYNDIVIKNKTLSGSHATINKVIENNHEYFILKDNDSTNFTYLNGLKISECKLTNNDLVRFGDVEFLFHDENSKEENRSTTSTLVNINLPQKVSLTKKDVSVEDKKNDKIKAIFFTILVTLSIAIVLLVIFIFNIIGIISKIQ